MEVTLASSDKLKKVCPYFRVGYCKYRNNCKHFHPSKDCKERKCSDKNCSKRHRKPCRFGETCSRISSCEFLHKDQRRTITDDSDLEMKVKELEELMKIKDAQILELSDKIKSLEAIESQNLNEGEAFECDKCDKISKSDNGLKIHKGKAHKKVITPNKECHSMVKEQPVSSQNSEAPPPYSALWPHIFRKGTHAKPVEFQCSRNLAGCGVPRHNEERGDHRTFCPTCRWKGPLYSCRTA